VPLCAPKIPQGLTRAGHRGEKQENNRLSLGTAFVNVDSLVVLGLNVLIMSVSDDFGANYKEKRWFLLGSKSIR